MPQPVLVVTAEAAFGDRLEAWVQNAGFDPVRADSVEAARMPGCACRMQPCSSRSWRSEHVRCHP